MSIFVIKTDRFDTGFVYDRRMEFLLDSADDFVLLPSNCPPGSKAYTSDMSAMWQMGVEGEWKRMVVSSGSGEDLEQPRESVSMVDKETGVTYMLEIINGTLTMTEVTE